MNDLSLYERILSASEAIQSNYRYGSKRAFFLEHEQLSILEYSSDQFAPYSSLPGLEDLNIIGGGLYSGDLAPDALIATEPIFDTDSQNDKRLSVLGIRLLQLLNIEELIVIGKGDYLKDDTKEELIFWAEDHINVSGKNPLVGANIDNFGERFPDMTDVYDSELTSDGIKVSEKLGSNVKTGVWATIPEENYLSGKLRETLINNEVTVISSRGMQEVIAAVHGNLKIALSLIINPDDDNSELIGKMLKGLCNGSN